VLALLRGGQGDLDGGDGHDEHRGGGRRSHRRRGDVSPRGVGVGWKAQR
jgi:hypothetical protein